MQIWQLWNAVVVALRIRPQSLPLRHRACIKPCLQVPLTMRIVWNRSIISRVMQAIFSQVAVIHWLLKVLCAWSLILHRTTLNLIQNYVIQRGFIGGVRRRHLGGLLPVTRIYHLFGRVQLDKGICFCFTHRLVVGLIIGWGISFVVNIVILL